MRVIDADVLFDVLHDRMKGAEEWIERAETDEIRSRAEGFLSALIEIKMSIEDEVTTIERPSVLCVDCKYFHQDASPVGYGWCYGFCEGKRVEYKDYCSRGAKMEGERFETD